MRHRLIVQSLLPAAATIALVGCDGGIDTEPFDPVSCTADYRPDVLTGLQLTEAVDYLELRELDSPYGETQVVQAAGRACDTATDRSACQAALVEASSVHGFELGQCLPNCPRSYLVLTAGDQVMVVNTAEQLREWIGPVDAPADAVMTVMLGGYQIACGIRERSGVLGRADGFEVLATRITKACMPVRTTLYRLKVYREGTIEGLETEVIEHDDECIPPRE